VIAQREQRRRVVDHRVQLAVQVDVAGAVSRSTITDLPSCHDLSPPGEITPYTPVAARASTATPMLANAAVPGRRIGGCSGSVSRATSADIARWNRNWWACN